MLLIVIGGALVLFILGDQLTGRTGAPADANLIGEVSGEEISVTEFDNRLNVLEQNYVRRTGQGIDDETRDLLRQQTFDLIIKERIMHRQYEEAGVVVTDRELYEMVSGKNPHTSVRQAFSNPQTGEFNPEVISRYLQNLETNETGEAKKEWIAFERQLKELRIEEKYNALIKKGLYVPTFLAKHDYVSKNKNATFNFLAKRYSSVHDSTIVITDEDLEDYFERNKEDYEQEASRLVEYVVFDINPSNEDVAETLKEMEEIKTEFAVAENDTAFVFENSDQPSIPATYAINELPAELDSSFFYAEKGTIRGPLKEGNSFKLIKLSNVFMQPDSAHARHILININNGDTAAAMAKVDSLKALITKNNNFEEVAKVESQDFGSASKGGDLDWFKPGAMVKSFNDAVFNGNEGDMAVVTSQFGIHLIEILDLAAPSRKIEVATVIQPINPGRETRDVAYTHASKFLSQANSEEGFEKAGENSGTPILVADNLKQTDRTIMGMENSRQVVRWAYENEEGAISQAFDLGDKYVIARLKETREEGYAEIEHIRPQLEIEVRKEKKAERFISEFNEAGDGDLNAISTATGVPVENATGVTFSAYSIPGVGREPEVAGTVFGLAPNAISKPVKGKTGVFVVSPQNFSEVTIPQDLKSSSKQMGDMLQNRVNFEVYEALKEKADVKNNLGRFN